ncbi:unnamed protein product [Ostreobium quekettii]|uniref:Uncharacterized protein n=1 Tax=Ostreobium quekettii TaxID=121088 RepID=A0A8S1IR22_9CHLO|nr:unnamed protein product [Ostreobium quekettii]
MCVGRELISGCACCQKKSHKKHKRHKKEKDKGPEYSGGAEKAVQNPISADDYFLKHSEFATWLQEKKGLYFNELSGDECRAKFEDFVLRWNAGKLADKYYLGLGAAPMKRTQHKWNFQGSKATGHEAGRTVAAPATGDQKGRRDADRTTERIEKRKWRKEQAELLDELLPKASGHQAQIEKKIARKEARRASSPDALVAMGDRDILGGTDSFEAAKRRQEAWRERKQQRTLARREEASRKLASYQAAEDQKMDQFRALIEASGGAIKIPKRGDA